MAFPKYFLNYSNFEIAFSRIVRSSHNDYKRFYRHLFSSYNLALKENLNDLIKDIRSGIYQPEKPTIIYQPKESTILRPLAVLSFCDLIVYQVLLNAIAEKFEKTQMQYGLNRSFGTIFAGKGSPFFFKSWKVCYAAYNSAITSAFSAENRYVADFDLVSFYELIDHNLLRCCLEKEVKNRELLDLLFQCLSAWTTDSGGAHLGHGVPQGPEPSAFLADCFLFHFDAKPFKQVRYLRYVDDIKLMAKDEAPLRRALLKLDLASKELGLVPQAQKIRLRKVTSLEEIQKTIPSAVASASAMNPTGLQSQKELIMMFRRSFRKRGKEWIIDDITKFKFSLLRLNPRRDVLQRVSSVLLRRPDCSYVIAAYLQKFPEDKIAADILLNALRQDPIYDAAAANYIEAMDVCGPVIRNPLYQQVIQTANRRSEEKSILLSIASLTFRGRRLGPKGAAKLIGRQKDPVVKGILLHRLFGDDPHAPFKLADCVTLLEKEIDGEDADLARFCASLLVLEWRWFVPNTWRPTKAAHHSVKLLLLGLGLRARAPRKQSVLEAFFRDKMRIPIPISWRKALRGDRPDAERRCLRLQQLQVGDPSARVHILDTFNEVLLQAFSRKHFALVSAYSKAAGKALHPDLGNWLYHPLLATVLPNGINWLRNVHETRVGTDLAHAKWKSGSKRGTSTKPVMFEKADALMKRAPAAWAELIVEWKKIL